MPIEGDPNKKRVMNFAINFKNVQNAQFLTTWQEDLLTIHT